MKCKFYSMNSVKRNHKGRFPSHIPLYIAYLNTLIPNSDKVYLSNPINLNIKNNSPIREKTINGINNLLALLNDNDILFLNFMKHPRLKKKTWHKKEKNRVQYIPFMHKLCNMSTNHMYDE